MKKSAVRHSAPPPCALTVGEGFVNPLGFHDPNLVFSWKLPRGVRSQTAFHIQARTDGPGWDSGWRTSDQSLFIPYGATPLASRQRVQWRVRYRNERGRESRWSSWAHVEMGLLANADWKAKWIRPRQPRPQAGEPAALLRREFQLANPIEKARLYVTARGVFEMNINGRRVGRDHFANGWTSYHKRLDTLAYDVTRMLRAGSNTIGALLGSGWYAGRFPFETQKKGPYGTDPELLVQLEITPASGRGTRVVSDESWEGTFDGPVISSSLYDGEQHDARIAPANWAPVLAQSDLGTARLAPKPFPPVRETQTLAAKCITQPQPGRFIFDLGQNMVGWARIRVPAKAHQTTTIRFAEMLKQDGTLYTENYRSAKSIDTHTAAKTGTVRWEPHFTFHGFRYVELSGFPAGAKPRKNWVTGAVLHSDLKPIGTFASSHAKLNQLQSNIRWGWRGNSLDIPTDCPQRDERCGWTGDAQVFCSTASFNYDGLAFWKSWLGSMRDDQNGDGSIPDIIPLPTPGWGHKSPGWLEAATFIPWDLFVRTGDTRILAENYDMMAGLVGWYRAQLLDGLLPNIQGFGDWLQPYPRVTAPNWMGACRGDTPTPLLGAAYFARSLRIMAHASAALGRAADAVRYTREADAANASFVRAYVDRDGRVNRALETQTAYVLALGFDLLPDACRARAADHLARLIRDAGGHLRTGFLGTPYIASVLDRTGHSDIACDLLFRETYPSWFYSINQGATTMWERWNSFSHRDGFGDVKMNSFNHYAYGAIGQWMYERIAGLAPDPARPGYKHFFVRPLICPQLRSAGAELDTPYGLASSAWKKAARTVELTVVIPPNTTATISLPSGDKSVQGSGKHRFSFRLPRTRPA